MTKISLVLPIYNLEKYIHKCLDSVFNQTFSDFEVICVNDGSTDGTLKVLEDYAKKDYRIRIINQVNQGAGAARNTGLKNAKGDYVVMMEINDFKLINDR